MIDTAVILAGGKGTRLSEFTKHMPKPMLAVGGVPILVHIMRHYMKHGVTHFVVPVGYLCEQVFIFFNNYGKFLTTGHRHSMFAFQGCDVTVVDTDEDTQTFGRLVRVRDFLPDKFYMTYGDGLSDVNISNTKDILENFETGLGVVTVVHPPARFGVVSVDDFGFVTAFNEKPSESSLINGGFFALKRELIDRYSTITNPDSLSFENDILPIACNRPIMMSYQHDGFWMCIDTARDLELANERYRDGQFLEG